MGSFLMVPIGVISNGGFHGDISNGGQQPDFSVPRIFRD